MGATLGMGAALVGAATSRQTLPIIRAYLAGVTEPEPEVEVTPELPTSAHPQVSAVARNLTLEIAALNTSQSQRLGDVNYSSSLVGT